jgi:hypothetical protein
MIDFRLNPQVILMLHAGNGLEGKKVKVEHIFLNTSLKRWEEKDTCRIALDQVDLQRTNYLRDRNGVVRVQMSQADGVLAAGKSLWIFYNF